MTGFDVLSLIGPSRLPVLLDSISSTARIAVPAGVAAYALALPVVEVPSSGLALAFDWGPVLDGTDRVELAPLTVEVAADRVADFGGYPLGELVTSSSDGALVVNVPAERRIRALTMHGLTSGGKAFRTEQQLRDAGRRLSVSQPDPRGGWAAPVVAVPEVDRHGQIPPSLTGGSLADGVLRLPDLTGPLKLAIVEGGTPDEFTVHPLTVTTVVGWAAPTPVDLALTGPDGTVLWNFAGAMPDGVRQSVDVDTPVAAAVETLRAAGSAVTGRLTLSARFPCRVGFRTSPVRGSLVRELPGTASVRLAGEPATLPVDRPLPPAAPASVVADVVVRYDGMRLADVSDPLPAAGAQQGVVVRREPVLRTLPPLALRGERLHRIGLVGYCPEPTALLVRLVPASAAGGQGGAALGLPGNVSVPASEAVAVIWVDLPEPVTVDQPVAIEVSAGSGRFNWVSGEEPLVRVVVLDPDPGGRPIVLGDQVLLSVDRPELQTVRASLPSAAFGGAAPTVASALFCTVEITDAELRYPRGA